MNVVVVASFATPSTQVTRPAGISIVYSPGALITASISNEGNVTTLPSIVAYEPHAFVIMSLPFLILITPIIASTDLMFLSKVIIILLKDSTSAPLAGTISVITGAAAGCSGVVTV